MVSLANVQWSLYPVERWSVNRFSRRHRASMAMYSDEQNRYRLFNVRIRSTFVWFFFFFFKIHFYVFDVVYYRRYRNKMGKQKSFETNRNACLLIAFRVRVYGCVFRPRRIHGPNRNDKISRTWKNGVKNLKEKIDVWKLRGEHFACRT